MLRFDRSQPPGARSLQGHSLAEWEPIGGPPVLAQRQGHRRGDRRRAARLKVVTTNMTEGWLRKNGVAYSESATLLEYWDRVAFPNGDIWLIVTSVVSDPRYLVNDYTTSMHFKREADGSKWKPTPCQTRNSANARRDCRRRSLAAASLNAPSSAQGQGQAAQPTMVDLAGSWTMSNEEELLIRIDPGPELGNFTGFPINAAGRQKALLLELDDPGRARASGTSASGAGTRCADPARISTWARSSIRFRVV